MATANGNGFIVNAGNDLPTCSNCGAVTAVEPAGTVQPASRFVSAFELQAIEQRLPVGNIDPVINVGENGISDTPPIQPAPPDAIISDTFASGGGSGGGGGGITEALAGDIGGIPTIVWIAVVGLVLLRAK